MYRPASHPTATMLSLPNAGLAGKRAIWLTACDPASHGAFIRDLTRQNFAALMARTVGWDEARHQQEPRAPDRYRMVWADDELIGFFAVREEGDALYLQTLQLVPEQRHRGYGTALLHAVADEARARGPRQVRCRAFKENPALAWYQRHGYSVVADEPHCVLMRRDVQ